MKDKGSNLLKAALILTLAAFISKVLSALYRIPLQNLTGDLGFYVYQQIYPFIGMIMILSLYGFPAAISKLALTTINEKEGRLSLYSFYLPLTFLLFIINALFFLIFILFSSYISSFIGDVKLASSFQILAFAFLLIPFVAICRGVFQAYGNMLPTAYSQVLDQFIRVAIIIAISFLVFYRDWSIYSVGNFGALATLAGLMASFILLFIFFMKKRPYSLHTYDIPWKLYIKTIVLFGFIAALNHMVLIILQFADVLTVVPSLINYGVSADEARQLKGILDRGQPLIQFGTIIGSSFALALMPATVDDQVKKDTLLDSILISVYISVAASIGLIVLMPEINTLLFKDLAGTLSLRILVSSILLTSLILTANALLQGFGYTIRTALYILVMLCVKLLLNIILIPLWGVNGIALATVISLVILAYMSLFGLQKETKLFTSISLIRWPAFMSSLLSMLVFLLLVKYLLPFHLFNSRLSLLIYVCIVISIAAFIYLFMLIKLRVLSNEQVAVLPGRKYLIKEE